MRRNPVLADIFSRLDYMERSGSGLGKIRDAQVYSANFVPERTPVFYSDWAGSGVPDIFSIWDEEGWIAPTVEEEYKPDRTRLTLAFKEK